MSGFVEFARAHGLNLDAPRNTGRIERCGTIEHPRKRNGAYVYDGTRGWVQNWETGGDLQWWKSDTEPSDYDKAKWERERKARNAERERQAQGAIRKATEYISRAEVGHHDYLKRKQLPDEVGFVLPSGELFIPMRSEIGGLRGGQVVTWDGDRWVKKMIFGTRANGSVFEIGTGQTVLCEGYATGLTIASVGRKMGLSLRAVVAFSADNMVSVASRYRRAWVFADNDASGTGERCAKLTGHPWVMSDIVGEDANDMLCNGRRMQLMALIQKGSRS